MDGKRYPKLASITTLVIMFFLFQHCLINIQYIYPIEKRTIEKCQIYGLH